MVRRPRHLTIVFEGSRTLLDDYRAGPRQMCAFPYLIDDFQPARSDRPAIPWSNQLASTDTKSWLGNERSLPNAALEFLQAGCEPAPPGLEGPTPSDSTQGSSQGPIQNLLATAKSGPRLGRLSDPHRSPENVCMMAVTSSTWRSKCPRSPAQPDRHKHSRSLISPDCLSN